ncbi:MAG: HPr family phosphocarrier protein [Clostridia bacterium]|nr:HPr family phosphocarrier protein [Clostridia bacterium]
MKQFSYVLTRSALLHARTAGGLIKEIARFNSSVSVRCGEKQTIIKKPKDILELGLGCGDEITIAVEGCDEEAAVAAIQSFIVAES